MYDRLSICAIDRRSTGIRICAVDHAARAHCSLTAGTRQYVVHAAMHLLLSHMPRRAAGFVPPEDDAPRRRVSGCSTEKACLSGSPHHALVTFGSHCDKSLTAPLRIVFGCGASCASAQAARPRLGVGATGVALALRKLDVYLKQRLMLRSSRFERSFKARGHD